MLPPVSGSECFRVADNVTLWRRADRVGLVARQRQPSLAAEPGAPGGARPRARGSWWCSAQRQGSWWCSAQSPGLLVVVGPETGLLVVLGPEPGTPGGGRPRARDSWWWSAQSPGLLVVVGPEPGAPGCRMCEGAVWLQAVAVAVARPGGQAQVPFATAAGMKVTILRHHLAFTDAIAAISLHWTSPTQTPLMSLGTARAQTHRHLCAVRRRCQELKLAVLLDPVSATNAIAATELFTE
eukprot:g46694.t1